MISAATASRERPGNLREAQECLRDCPGRLIFRGGGTKLDWGNPPEGVETVVETTRLDALVRHDPGDATATVQAGMPLQRLQRRLAGHGQWLAVDPPTTPGTTVGGVFVAGDAGPRRLRYGTLRDLVIGVTVVLADGTVARSGGNVIKNVAGYDLAKLFCGSLGTLGLVAELTVRLHPLPAHTASVRISADAAAVPPLLESLLSSPVEPTAVDWGDGSDDPSADAPYLLVRLEGHPEAVRDQVEEVRSVAGRHTPYPVDVLEGEEERTAWHDAGVSAAGLQGETVVRAAAPPTRLAQVHAALARAVDAAGATRVTAAMVSHAAVGVHHARLAGSPSAQADVIGGWREALARLGGHAVIRRRGKGLADDVDAWGSPPDAIDLMRRLKQRFDPQRRCAPGRFVGGI